MIYHEGNTEYYYRGAARCSFSESPAPDFISHAPGTILDFVPRRKEGIALTDIRMESGSACLRYPAIVIGGGLPLETEIRVHDIKHTKPNPGTYFTLLYRKYGFQEDEPVELGAAGIPWYLYNGNDRVPLAAIMQDPLFEETMISILDPHQFVRFIVREGSSCSLTLHLREVTQTFTVRDFLRSPDLSDHHTAVQFASGAEYHLRPGRASTLTQDGEPLLTMYCNTGDGPQRTKR